MIKKIVFFILFILILLSGFFTYLNLGVDQIQVLIQKNVPFSVRIAVLDDTQNDSLEFLAQFIVYPKYKHIILYALNTEANLNDKLIQKLSPVDADNFEAYTQIENTHYIHLRRSQASRLLDLYQGMNFYLEDNVFLKNSQYQYPKGSHYFSGEQLFEYFINQTLKSEENREFSFMERLYRQESIFLDLFWQRQSTEVNSNVKINNFAMRLIDTNFKFKELESLMKFILDSEVYLQTLEVPLQLLSKNGKQILKVNEERAPQVYKEFIARSQIKWLKPTDNFSVQILNGTETSGLARIVRDALQNIGPNILDVDNYKYKPLMKTMLLECSGNTYIAQKMSQLLNMGRNRVGFTRKASDIEISFLVGQDFSAKKLKLQ